MTSRRRSRPHIVLVLVDDQGYGDLSGHGHPDLATPHLDALAGESVCFTDFHTSPMCTPTRGSLLTGLDALRHRAVNVSSGRSLLRTDVATLPELLSDAGYETGLFGKWHLGDNHPYTPGDRGFGRARWFPSSHVTSAPDRWANDYFDTWLRNERGETAQYPGYCTDLLFDLALDFVRDAEAEDRPAFAYLSLNAPHKPWLVPDRYREPYRHVGGELASYFGMVANLDWNMGRLEQRLRELSLREDTVVVYLSDNGGDADSAAYYNAGMRGSKTDLWEGGHRVPLFVRWPDGGIGGRDGGRSVDELAVAQDLMPTLLELGGATPPAYTLDGCSLASLLEGSADRLYDRKCVIQYSTIDDPEPRRDAAAVLWRRWRLVHGSQLFDLDSDPGQEHDVAAAHPDVVASMREHYSVWWNGVAAFTTTFLAIPVGVPGEDPVMLSSADWQDVYLDQQAQVRRGVNRSGAWGLGVRRPGRYRFELLRWPREAELPIAGPAPAYRGGDCTFPAGTALPIARARLRIGELEPGARQVLTGDVRAAFQVELPVGAATLWAWFEDAAGHHLCGAYYVWVEYLGSTGQQAGSSRPR